MTAMNAVDAKLLELVRCPECRSSLIEEPREKESELACTGCGLRYPVRNGVPVLLVDEARRP